MPQTRIKLTVTHDKRKKLHIQCKPNMNSLADSEYFVNNFKLGLTIVLLKVRKDVKLTTLGGRLFQATFVFGTCTCDQVGLRAYLNSVWHPLLNPGAMA